MEWGLSLGFYLVKFMLTFEIQVDLKPLPTFAIDNNYICPQT